MHAELLRGVTDGAPRAKLEKAPVFLALSVVDAAEDVIATIRASARGYVTKTITATDLIHAIRRVSDGDAVFSPRLAGFVLDAFAGSIEVAAVDEDLDRLTEREREVMRLIARGYSYKEDLQALRPYIREYKPVIIGVDGGADAVLDAGFKPTLIVGDMDSVSDKALTCGAEIVVHAYRDGRAPGMLVSHPTRWAEVAGGSAAGATKASLSVRRVTKGPRSELGKRPFERSKVEGEPCSARRP